MFDTREPSDVRDSDDHDHESYTHTWVRLAHKLSQFH